MRRYVIKKGGNLIISTSTKVNGLTLLTKSLIKPPKTLVKTGDNYTAIPSTKTILQYFEEIRHFVWLAQDEAITGGVLQ